MIIDWADGKAKAFGRQTVAFRHDLHERTMFSDRDLAGVLDRYPRERLGVFAMGDDPADWSSWRRGTADRLTGSELLEGAKSGRIWLNLRAVNASLSEYANLADEIFSDLEANVPGLKTFKQDVGLLISSPLAHVSYHLDVASVTLWQVRGRKRMWVYPRCAPYVADEQLERIVLRDSAEQLPYEPSWDEAATLVTLDPGVMVSWPQNAPHRIVNDAMLNVSLSIEYMTPQALMRANVIFANGLIRQRLGSRPCVQDDFSAVAALKFGIARAAKALRLHPATGAELPAMFQLCPDDPGTPVALD